MKSERWGSMIVNNLKELMERENINISELSAATDITRNTISSLINKGSKLTAYKKNTIEQLCSYFGVGIGDIFFFIDETITVDHVFSLTPTDQFKKTAEGNYFLEARINYILRNSHKRSATIDCKVLCTTDLQTILKKNNGTERVTYNLIEFEIDDRFGFDTESKTINSSQIRNLCTLSDFIPTHFFPFVPDLLEENSTELGFHRDGFYKIKLRYNSTYFSDNLFEKEWAYFYNFSKKGIAPIDYL